MKNKFSIFEETRRWAHERDVACDAHATVSSTNDLAKTEAFKPIDHVKLYLTDAQTAGRGRSQNTWLNPAVGDSLMCSWSFRCRQNPQAVTGPLIGLALYQALHKAFTLSQLSIKAPNDIYLGEKKILGILVETVSRGDEARLIIGFGLNVFSHPADLPLAGHLSTGTDLTVVMWHEFMHKVLLHLQEAARAALATHITDAQRETLLAALNANPLLDSQYLSVSPFGDLVQRHHTTSWRNL